MPRVQGQTRAADRRRRSPADEMHGRGAPVEVWVLAAAACAACAASLALGRGPAADAAAAARWAWRCLGPAAGEGSWPAPGDAAAALASVYLAAAAARAAWAALRFAAVPSNLVGRDTDPWMGTDSSAGREKLAGNLPPPFPRGWFRLADTIDVAAPGAHVVVRRLGRWLAVYRPAPGGPALVAEAPSGDPGAVAVRGDRLEGGGAAWEACEANGHVYGWHALGDPSPPAWMPIRPEELRGAYRYHGRSENSVTTHVCEIPENGADVAHLPVLHSDFIVRPLQPLLNHHWEVSWRPGNPGAGTGERREFSYVRICQAARLWRRYELPGSRLAVDIVQQGLGIVSLKFATPFGFVYVLETVTPVEPLLQKYHHTVWAEWRVPRFVAKGVLHGLLVQAERDVPIWNHKAYQNPPLIVRGDGPIAQFRRWTRQFFAPPGDASSRRVAGGVAAATAT